ncbi:MAG: shikimate kinase [bacterium]|nr:shikimate kinase [bacterium]
MNRDGKRGEQSVARKHIFLIGFMGAGKSTAAKKLCEMTGKPVVEMDARIEQEEGRKISQIFEESGEAYFRTLETGLLQTLRNEKSSIVSCGGGVPMREENRESMRENGYTVLLTAKPQTIFERVRYSKDRPVLNKNMSVEYIEELMEKRREAYETAADITVWTDGKDMNMICEEILKEVRKAEEKEIHRENAQ